MKLTTIFRENVLTATDTLLEQSGYKRPPREQSWWKKVSDEQWFLFHLNFGLYERTGEVSVIPSVGLKSAWLTEKAVDAGIIEKKHSKYAAQFGKTLTSSCWYSINNDPITVAQEILDSFLLHGVPYLEKIKDYNVMIDLLSSDNLYRDGNHLTVRP